MANSYTSDITSGSFDFADYFIVPQAQDYQPLNVPAIDSSYDDQIFTLLVWNEDPNNTCIVKIGNKKLRFPPLTGQVLDFLSWEMLPSFLARGENGTVMYLQICLTSRVLSVHLTNPITVINPAPSNSSNTTIPQNSPNTDIEEIIGFVKMR